MRKSDRRVKKRSKAMFTVACSTKRILVLAVAEAARVTHCDLDADEVVEQALSLHKPRVGSLTRHPLFTESPVSIEAEQEQARQYVGHLINVIRSSSLLGHVAALYHKETITQLKAA